jgi:hypothetical protein
VQQERVADFSRKLPHIEDMGICTRIVIAYISDVVRIDKAELGFVVRID